MKKIMFVLMVGLMFVVPRQSFAGSYSLSVGVGEQMNKADESLLMIRGGYEIKILADNKSAFVLSLEPALIRFSGGQIGTAVGTVFENQFSISGTTKLIFSWGCGVLVTDKKLLGEALVFNFTLQGGVGISHEIGGGKSLLAEVRYWHASNGGLADPNFGIDDIVLFVGTKF